MSNHKLSPVVRLNEVSICDYSFYFETDSSGDPVASSVRGQYWLSFTKTSTGLYTCILNDTFRKVLCATASVAGDNDFIAKFSSTVTIGSTTTTMLLYTYSAAAKTNVTSGVVSGLVRAKATIAGEGL